MPRRILPVLLLALALPVAAQQPPKLEPLPELPPPPPGAVDEEPAEAPVRIEPGQSEQIKEEVIDGKRVARVNTAEGTEYYLIEDLGDGAVSPRQGLNPGVRVPLWVIRRF